VSRWVWIALVSAAAMVVATVRLSPPLAPHLAAPTSLTDAPHAATVPPVRVRLGESDVWRIRIDGPYQIMRPGDWRILAQGSRLEESDAIAETDRLRIADRAFDEDSLELRVVRPGSLWVEDTQYRGDLLLVRADGARLLAVNLVALADYLASVVNGEMPASFPDEARRAQAIVARTYAVYHMKTAAAGQHYDLRADEGSQVYRGTQYVDNAGRRLAAETPDSRRIVVETRGVVATYRGRLFCTFYAAVCGGHTMRGETVFPAAAPPLVGGPCEYCGDGPNYRWQVDFNWRDTEPKLLRFLAGSGRRLDSISGLKTIDRGDGIPAEVEITGEPATRRISTTQMRRRVLGSAQLPSDRFSVELDGERLRVQGRGWGHGVGMCQWGARGQAIAGRTCREILEHYYPGCELVRLR